MRSSRVHKAGSRSILSTPKSLCLGFLVALICVLILGGCDSAGRAAASSDKSPVNATTAGSAGSAERGQRFFVQCRSCHTVEPGGANLTGPNLAGIVGRAAGKHPDFAYSPALAAADFVWTEERLDAFLTEPAAAIEGTSMIFTGIRGETIRRDLLAYLSEAAVSRD